ncbi:MAG: hypothetical protein COX82_01580 [Candidatus Magasanikbacteria bacterium CG_4_10_14_0_2_um_filter_41_10]|uniref:Uncharacterized protein n=1 Tax=Candidatus Magasanikbacteria bacterium CG_4_10_14_0_2_um_filter_41_10 TaxID=1974638 RepID=A0A2M7V5W4_9BACT|nr:MAG: hypothetical protein COX82_01580 [Candidatus Magasanikbacteria bacterium CG_4_10_14_0_2_um_filter_41_10]
MTIKKENARLIDGCVAVAGGTDRANFEEGDLVTVSDYCCLAHPADVEQTNWETKRCIPHPSGNAQYEYNLNKKDLMDKMGG